MGDGLVFLNEGEVRELPPDLQVPLGSEYSRFLLEEDKVLIVRLSRLVKFTPSSEYESSSKLFCEIPPQLFDGLSHLFQVF